MEAALSIAACGRAAAQPCDGGGRARRNEEEEDHGPDSAPATQAPLVLVTDRLDTPGGAAVFDRAWADLARMAATGRAQASRVAVLALDRPPALYRARLSTPADGGGSGCGDAGRWAAAAATISAAAAARLVRVVDGYSDPFGWIGEGVEVAADCRARVDDLRGLARAATGAAADSGSGSGSGPHEDGGSEEQDRASLLVVIDSLSALLARHAPLDVLRWLEADVLRSPRVSAVVAFLHSDEEAGGQGQAAAAAAAAGGASVGDASARASSSSSSCAITAAFEALASACLQLRPLTPAQRDLSGADGELRVVSRRRGQGGGGGALAAAAAAAAAAAGAAAGGGRAAATAAVDSTRVFGGAGRPRAERLLYTLGCSGDEEEGGGEQGLEGQTAEGGCHSPPPPPSLARWLRARVAVEPMPREVALPDARSLAARAAERGLNNMPRQAAAVEAGEGGRDSDGAGGAGAAGSGGGHRHDRRPARPIAGAAPAAAGAAGPPAHQHQQQQQQEPRPPRREWAPLGHDGGGSKSGEPAAAAGPPPAAPPGPGRILFERDSGGSSAESGADPDEDLEL